MKFTHLFALSKTISNSFSLVISSIELLENFHILELNKNRGYLAPKQ